MKKFVCTMLAVIICFSLLASCDDSPFENSISQSTVKDTETNTETIIETETEAEAVKECSHAYEPIDEYDEYTVEERCSICGLTRIYTISENDPESSHESGFKMCQYHWSGSGVSYKNVYTCELAYSIIDCLINLQETGEIIPKISDDVINDFTNSLPVERGTMWIECGSVGMFRLNPELTEICKVQTHLGEGKALQMTDTLRELLQNAWSYHPFDYWLGTFENGTLSLKQVYKSESAVENVAIKSIHIENEHSVDSNNITLTILANENKPISAYIESFQSSDNYASSDTKDIELISGEEISVDFSFGGFKNHTYSVLITIDNTRIRLLIYQTSAQ